MAIPKVSPIKNNSLITRLFGLSIYRTADTVKNKRAVMEVIRKASKEKSSNQQMLANYYAFLSKSV